MCDCDIELWKYNVKTRFESLHMSEFLSLSQYQLNDMTLVAMLTPLASFS